MTRAAALPALLALFAACAPRAEDAASSAAVTESACDLPLPLLHPGWTGLRLPGGVGFEYKLKDVALAPLDGNRFVAVWRRADGAVVYAGYDVDADTMEAPSVLHAAGRWAYASTRQPVIGEGAARCAGGVRATNFVAVEATGKGGIAQAYLTRFQSCAGFEPPRTRLVNTDEGRRAMRPSVVWRRGPTDETGEGLVVWIEDRALARQRVMGRRFSIELEWLSDPFEIWTIEGDFNIDVLGTDVVYSPPIHNYIVGFLAKDKFNWCHTFNMPIGGRPQALGICDYNEGGHTQTSAYDDSANPEGYYVSWHEGPFGAAKRPYLMDAEGNQHETDLYNLVDIHLVGVHRHDRGHHDDPLVRYVFYRGSEADFHMTELYALCDADRAWVLVGQYRYQIGVSPMAVAGLRDYTVVATHAADSTDGWLDVLDF
jgi:hypothetical protein